MITVLLLFFSVFFLGPFPVSAPRPLSIELSCCLASACFPASLLQFSHVRALYASYWLYVFLRVDSQVGPGTPRTPEHFLLTSIPLFVLFCSPRDLHMHDDGAYPSQIFHFSRRSRSSYCRFTGIIMCLLFWAAFSGPLFWVFWVSGALTKSHVFSCHLSRPPCSWELDPCERDQTELKDSIEAVVSSRWTRVAFLLPRAACTLPCLLPCFSSLPPSFPTQPRYCLPPFAGCLCLVPGMVYPTFPLNSYTASVQIPRSLVLQVSFPTHSHIVSNCRNNAAVIMGSFYPCCILPFLHVSPRCIVCPPSSLKKLY